jgi:hypothetical protein
MFSTKSEKRARVGGEGRVAQTMYAHVSKCKNDKGGKKIKPTANITINGEQLKTFTKILHKSTVHNLATFVQYNT